MAGSFLDLFSGIPVFHMRVSLWSGYVHACVQFSKTVLNLYWESYKGASYLPQISH